MEENHNTQTNEIICEFVKQLSPGFSYKPNDEEIVGIILYKKATGEEILTAPIFLLDSMADSPDNLIGPFPCLNQSDNYHFLFKGEPQKKLRNDLEWKHTRTGKLKPIAHGITIIGYKEKYCLKDHTKRSTGWQMTAYKLEPEAFNHPLETEWRFIKLEPPQTWRTNQAGIAHQLYDGEVQYEDASLTQSNTQCPEMAHQETNEPAWDQLEDLHPSLFQ